jgi:hypothetical protein
MADGAEQLHELTDTKDSPEQRRPVHEKVPLLVNPLPGRYNAIRFSGPVLMTGDRALHPS